LWSLYYISLLINRNFRSYIHILLFLKKSSIIVSIKLPPLLYQPSFLASLILANISLTSLLVLALSNSLSKSFLVFSLSYLTFSEFPEVLTAFTLLTSILLPFNCIVPCLTFVLDKSISPNYFLILAFNFCIFSGVTSLEGTLDDFVISDFSLGSTFGLAYGSLK